MMASSNGNIFRITGPLCGEFTGPGEFPTQRPVTRSFDVFFELRLNKRLSKQPWGWWFETPSWSLWRQCNEIMIHKRVVQWMPCLTQSGDFPSQSPPFRGAKYRTSPVRQVRHTASCGFMVDPCGAPWWPLRCNGLDALSSPYVYAVISPNMPSHIPTEWDPLHTKHSISLQSLGPSE